MEIERRFLVSGWPELTPEHVYMMEQGYISTRPAVRIRREKYLGGETAFVLCFKQGAGLVRQEIELALSGADFLRLKEFIGLPLIQKEQRRYALSGGLTLEVNSVDPSLPSAFFYAEVEFPDAEQARSWEPPAALAGYLAHEVTGQAEETMAAYWGRTRLEQGS